MTTFESISTGIKGLDAVLNKLRIGDNVVWQVENIDDYSHYVIPFVQKRIEEGKRVVYLRFAEHKPILNQSDKIKIYQLDANSGFEAFTTQAYNIVSQEGKDVFYIFDCLSSLLSAWVMI